jgi:hypothetical protein
MAICFTIKEMHVYRGLRGQSPFVRGRSRVVPDIFTVVVGSAKRAS